MTSNIPDAPAYIPSRPNIRSPLSPKSLLAIECRKLSKANCGKNNACRFSDHYNICEPKHSLAVRRDQVQSYDEYLFESRRIWRSGVIGWLSEAECNINNFIENITVFKNKASASDSIIISGLIRPTALDKKHSNNSNVIIKLTFNPIDPLDNSLEVERAIYKNIITKLVNGMHTPNVMSYLGNITCKGELADMFYKKQTLEIDPYAKAITATQNYYPDVKNLLILERSSGTELQKWLLSDREESEIISVMFQVMYTLVCFKNLKLMHNDLHFGNIFIEDMGRPITLYFVNSSRSWVKLVTRYIPKIYDFDRASINYLSVPRNLELDKYYCKDYGTCNRFYSKYDFFQFISTLRHQYYEKIIGPDINKFISSIMDVNWYNKLIGDTSRVRPNSLQYTDSNPSQFKEVDHALIEFIAKKWDNPPFIVEIGDISVLPKELTYTPPKSSPNQIVYYNPTSTEPHPSLSIVLPEWDNSFYGDTEIYTVWENELKMLNIGVLKLAETLFFAVPDDKHPTKSYGSWYHRACILLSFPMFHKITREQQLALCNKQMMAVVDDIWNIFNNQLPIQIPRV